MGRGTVTAKTVMVGLAHLADRICDPVRIAQHLGSRYPDDGQPLFFQPILPLLVALRPIRGIVLLPVNFENMFDGCAIEVGDVWSDRMLPSNSRLGAPKPGPQQNFRRR